VAGALFVDVDGFKRVNDELGHSAGDQVLTVVGERLQAVVRAQDTVGRLGGDEFIVLAECAVDDPALDLLADRVANILREPVELDDGRAIRPVTASVGVAIGQYDTADALLRDADLALYAAKAAGKDRYALFDSSMRAGEARRIDLEADLDRALTHEQFFLLYQPIFDLSSHELVDVEALIRWQHPTRGVVDPERFVPLAEESGLIVELDRWVLDRACRQAGAWALEGHASGMAVNVSAYQLGRRGFTEDVRQALETSGIEPSRLILEITETTLMRDVSAACAALQQLKALGVRIAIDDFGTGYASLSYLQRMPADILKIDKSFVAAVGDDPKSHDLMRAILGVAQSLSLAVVAEGVEDPAQLSALEELGCEMAQGFLLGRPAPPRDIEELLASRRLSRGDPPREPQLARR
jgi:diguanylate cyclase (GGDEF)-like protein